MIPKELNNFINRVEWTYAKTMPKWPHEYIVRKNVDERLFLDLVKYIRANGYLGTFYHKPITYLDHDGMVYWTMGAPFDETIIVNRCKKEDSYEIRLVQNKLPK